MCYMKHGYILIERLYVGKNIYYLSLLLCIVFVSNAMEDQIQELLSPAVRRDLAGARSEQQVLTGCLYVDGRMLAMQARQRLSAAQDLHTLESKQALQRLICIPSQEQETDWQLAVEGDTELHTAIRKKDDDLLHVLLLHSQGADINKINARGDTPLLLASQTDRSRYYLPRLFRYPLDVHVKNAAGFTALYYAVKNNDDCCMEMLLKHGADPKFVDKDDNTLLHIAAQSDAFYSAGHLARYKLNPNQLNKYKLAPLHIAILKHFDHTAHSIIWLADTNPNIPMAGESPLIFAVRNELLEVVRDLVEKGADVNAKDAMGHSALDLALTRRDNISIMYELLKHGADPDAKDANGDTPLARALKTNDIEAARILILLGANPNIPDTHGVMPIFHILRLNDLDCAALLVERGADPHVRDAEGNTPLHLAVEFEYVVYLLIKHGARIDTVNIHGDSPLHCVESMTPRSAYVLRWNGADINLKNKEGYTPYEKATRYCGSERSLDGRLLRILEPSRSHGLLGCLSSDQQPKITRLACASDYEITVSGLPGMDDTQSRRFIAQGPDSRIEYVDDYDEKEVAAASEEPGSAQESQPGNNVLTGNLRIGMQMCTKLWEQAVACFCPRVHAAKQSHDDVVSNSEQAGVRPVIMINGASAPFTDAYPQGSSTGSLVKYDTGLRQRTHEARFLASGQP